MDPIVTTACELLAQGRNFVLATIIRQQGSTPRTSGTRMLITAEQKIIGTIGGGLLEAKTMQTAALMTAQEPGRILSFDLTNKDAAKMEMMCGGKVQVLLDLIPANEENLALFKSWQEAASQGRRAMFVSIVSRTGAQVERIDHVLLEDNGLSRGGVELQGGLRETLSRLLVHASQIQVLGHEGRLVVADPGLAEPALYLFGAGHVARPTAHLAAMTGFAVTVVDDRADFADAANFPEAASVRVIAGFDSAFDHLAVDPNSYIIIVTRGHLHDKVVLAQALKTPAAYIGMIGSRRKRDTIYASLLEEGFTDDDLARVHCPIGLGIGADSPEEIAVSIAAELIAVRAGVRP